MAVAAYTTTMAWAIVVAAYRRRRLVVREDEIQGRIVVGEDALESAESCVSSEGQNTAACRRKPLRCIGSDVSQLI